jgi:hypothetical protein
VKIKMVCANYVWFWVWHGFDLVDEIEMGSLNQSCRPSLGCHILDLVGF